MCRAALCCGYFSPCDQDQNPQQVLTKSNDPHSIWFSQARGHHESEIWKYDTQEVNDTHSVNCVKHMNKCFKVSKTVSVIQPDGS